jgi:hypothetical protein
MSEQAWRVAKVNKTCFFVKGVRDERLVRNDKYAVTS